MVEYLATHNVTMVGFVILLTLWLLGAFLFGYGIYILVKNSKKIKTDPLADAVATYTLVGLVGFIIFLGPIMACGFWHFLNMVLTLCFGFNLY